MSGVTRTRAGDLRERVTIERPQKSLKDSGQQKVVTWKYVAGPLPAKVIGVGGRENRRGEQIEASVDYIVRIRYLQGVTPKMRVDWFGRKLEISRAIDRFGDRMELDLHCTEVV